jgi:dimethylamine/trimethylamine dehydrogenase
MSVVKPSQRYLDTLLQYYEEEVSGEAYFLGLANHMEQKDKLDLLAQVERHAAKAVEPLLTKHRLTPRTEDVLAREGIESVGRHASMEWREFVQYMVDRYPKYLDDFATLEKIAPAEDLAALNKLTEHEVAAIEFAKRELAEDANSCAPLKQYLTNSFNYPP